MEKENKKKQVDNINLRLLTLSSAKDLGEKEKEFKLYGNKTNTFIHQGVKYTIPKE